jgi:RHS repeat-associated protein
MTAGGVTTGYNWDAGWNVINEEDGTGTLARTYFHHPQLPIRATMAHVDGTSPSTGAYNYYAHDHLGSTRALFDASKALAASYAYSAYGEDYGSGGTVSTTHRFTGHDWNRQSGLYFAPYRFYDVSTSRWTVRDPDDMVNGPNLYAYPLNPALVVDPTGGKWMRVKCVLRARTAACKLYKCLAQEDYKDYRGYGQCMQSCVDMHWAEFIGASVCSSLSGPFFFTYMMIHAMCEESCSVYLYQTRYRIFTKRCCKNSLLLGITTCRLDK